MSFGTRVQRRGRSGVWAAPAAVFFFASLPASHLPVWAGEESLTDRQKAIEAYVALEEGKNITEMVPVPQEQAVLLNELSVLRKELLRRPKKNRFRFGQDTHYTYDSNPNRVRIHASEKGDSTFRINPFAEVDLSGARTDLRLEYRWNRLYNVKRPASDSFNQETSLRFSRNVLPKTTLALNDRLGRSSVRVAGRDNKKIGWDNAHRATLNYKLNRKVTLSLESNFTRSNFPAELDDETGTLTYSLDPNLTLQITPKSRFTMSYRWNFTRIPTESSDATTHEFSLVYANQMTPKSSLSTGFSYGQQDPDSAQVGSSDTLNSHVGTMWQATPKTSIRLLYSNSTALGVSDSISGTSLLKSTTHTASDTVSLSIRVRLRHGVTGEFSFNPSHSHSKTKQTGVDNTRSRTFSFPFQVAFDVDLTKRVKLRLTYTYRHQIGNEHKTDQNRAHTWFVGCNTAL